MNNMEKEIIEVSLDDIIPNRFQPRLSFDEDALNELAKSIRQHGIIQPLVLRKVGNKYEIIAGERRFKASFIAGLTKVPAVVIDLNDNESAEVAIVENIQRKNLSALEEAKSYKKLLDRGYLTQEELATRMGKTQGAISNKLRLLNLSNEVQEALLNNEISERHARSLLKIENEEDQVEVLRTIIRERLNVRDTDKLIDSLKKTEELAPIRTYGKTLGGSSNNTIDFDNLFGDIPQIEDKTYPEIEDKVYPAIETEETLLLDDEQDEDKKDILLEKIRDFIEELKEEGYTATYDTYEFDKLFEFIIKIDK
jgi:ParB family chromosome partitioning protein